MEVVPARDRTRFGLVSSFAACYPFLMSPEDVRVYNIDPSGRRITFSVARPEPTASPSLRRSIRHTPFALDRGASIDMCTALRCDPPQAAQWLKLSPDVTWWVQQGALRVGPPPAPVAIPVPAPAAADEGPAGPASASEAASEPEASPASPPAPPPAPEPEKVLYAMPIPGQPGRSHGIWVTPAQLAEIQAGAGMLQDAPPAPGAPPPIAETEDADSGLPDDEDTAAAVENAARVDGSADDGQPSAAWSRERLAEMAQRRGINCEGRSKAWILREIRDGGRR